jgi:tRNA(adenine34) deaminase
MIRRSPPVCEIVNGGYLGKWAIVRAEFGDCDGNNCALAFMDQPSQFDLPHEFYMRHALREAEAAGSEDEVPIGAVIVHHDPVGDDDRVIGAAHNQREQLRDPTAHAEMLAITQAAQALNNWRLENCTLYVTLEPCPMCAGAIVLARIPRVVYGAPDPKAGAATTLYHLLDDPHLNHRAEVVAGVLVEPCGQILSEFFARKRQNSAR